MDYDLAGVTRICPAGQYLVDQHAKQAAKPQQGGVHQGLQPCGRSKEKFFMDQDLVETVWTQEPAGDHTGERATS